MGLIFPWQAVREHQIPTILDLHRVSDEIKESLTRTHPSVIHAATIWGSVGRGDVTPRSDIDLILVAQDARMDDARLLLSTLRRQARQQWIMLSPHLYSVSEAMQGRHRFGPSFGPTFAQTTRWPFYLGPIDRCFTLPRHMTVREEMEEKITRTLRGLRVRMGCFERGMRSTSFVNNWLIRNWCEVFRPLRAHVVLARQLLWWRAGVIPDDSKAAVTDWFLTDTKLQAFRDSFCAMQDIDHGYVDLLDRTSSGDIGQYFYLVRARQFVRQAFRVAIDLYERASAFVDTPPTTQRAISAA